MHHPWELMAVSAVSAKHNISTAAVAAQDPAFILSLLNLGTLKWHTTGLCSTGWKRLSA